MGTPLSRAIEIATKVVGDLPTYKKAPPPLPPPPPPVRAVMTAEAPKTSSRFDEVMSAVQKAYDDTPVPDGHSRLYRYGHIPTDSVANDTRTLFGQTYTPEQWDKFMASKGMRNTEPLGARGRWFTDAPKELDYYVNDSVVPRHLYSVDVPSAQLPEINVSKTPYASSSSNHEREFLVPDEYIMKARRLLEGGSQ